MHQATFYTEFTQNLTNVLLQMGTQEGLLGGQMLITDDLEEKWKQIAPEYMADAVPEVIDYPTVAIAWAAYLGMGVGLLWDADWENNAQSTETYKLFVTPRGFDAMDEYIMDEYFGVKPESEEFVKIETFLRNAANTAITFIRKEQIDPQSKEAYQIFADAIAVFFKLGASICLHRLGYKFHLQSN